MASVEQHAEVVVLGAGIIGSTCAYYLAAEGRDVVLIDRQPGAGLETSFANGGVLAPSMSDPWAGAGVPGYLLKSLGREEAPLLLRLRAIPGMMGWGLQFLRNCNHQAWLKSTGITLSLAKYSKRVLDNLLQTLDIEHDRSDTGTLHLLRDSTSLKAGFSLADVYRSLDLDCTKLDRDQTIVMEPSLTAVKDTILGSVHYPDDRSGDAQVFSRCIASAAEDLGVRLLWNTTVRHLDVQSDHSVVVEFDGKKLRTNKLVIALGAQTPFLGKALGLKIPVYPAKGYSVTLPFGDWNGAPNLAIADMTQKIGMTRLGNRLRLAGTVEFDGYNTAINPRRCEMLVTAAKTNFPDLPLGPGRIDWAGLRPMTPDCRPIIGRVGSSNVLLNTGHGALGWTLAAGSARIVSDLVVGRTPEVDISGFDPNRF